MRVFTVGVVIFLASAAWAAPEKVQIPNDLHYWEKQGFVEMTGALRLPSDKEQLESIRVMLKVPDSAKISVSWVAPQSRYSLVYPAGTVADRVDSSRENPQSEEGVDDVRGARIDAELNTIFHDYETVPDADQQWLQGYEWKREGAKADAEAADALVGLFFPSGHNWDPSVIQHFRQLNQCAACHLPDAPSPATTAPPFRFQSDSRGFFQPLTVLDDSETVRDHRDWDLNADDPFISVWCGDHLTHAIVNGDVRKYQCPGDVAPVGKLDLVAALQHGDAHAKQLCQARTYLFQHMDPGAQKAFAAAFAECGI